MNVTLGFSAKFVKNQCIKSLSVTDTSIAQHKRNLIIPNYHCLLKCEDGYFLDTETLGALTKSSNLTRDKCQANEGKQGSHTISKLLYAKQFPLLPNMVDGHRSLDPKQQLQQKEIEV